MMLKSMTTLAFAAACLTAAGAIPAAHAQYAPGEQTITNGPQSSGVERSGAWSPRRNVIESEHYSRLVQTNPRFRAQRMRKECGPITDAQLHAQCIDSFNQSDSEPSVGSSMAPQGYSTNNGQ
ncbi:MAG TPA: hypothetical protein VMS01_14595 [Stellaceae bacterium]|jgi:hypothetical protein|nr:hypothetical protein [Stellaceae bacterium]